MLFVLLLRYITGYVCFNATGGFPERFINLCKARNIRIWNLTIGEKNLSGYVRSKDYFHLRSIAKTSGMGLRAKEKHGLVFFLNRNKNRIGLLISAAFFSVLLFVLSMFIWSVDVTGNENISSAQILSVVNSLGLKVGSFAPSVNAQEIAQSTLNELNGEIMWAAINIEGSRAVVEVRDYIERNDDETYGDPCNVVADFDGLLISVEVHSGKKANFEGNGVKKGDIIISGILEDRYFASHFYESRGVITALHEDEISYKQKKETAFNQYTKEKSVNYLNFFSLSIPLGLFGKSGNYDEFIKTRNLCINGIELPFGVSKKTRAYYKSGEAVDSHKLTFDDFTSICYDKYKNTTLLSGKLKINEKGGELSIKQNSVCIDFMGKQQKINLSDFDSLPDETDKKQTSGN